MGQQTWDWLKASGIQCESRRSAKDLFAYGATEPLLTLETFSAKVVSTRSNAQCQADFVVIKGGGHTLLGREMVETHNIASEHSEDDIRLLGLVFSKIMS